MSAKKATTKTAKQTQAKASKAQPARTVQADAPAKPSKLSALDAAAKVLGEAKEAMNCQAMIEAMATQGYWKSLGGKTPASTLYSSILYADLFGEATVTGNRQWLVRRIAWRMQALAEGGLSDCALRRAAELADDADLRLAPPRTPQVTTAAPDRSREGEPHRLAPGTILRRPYKGKTLQVKVLADGFEFEGKTYSSLSAVAKAVTGSHTSGVLFFRLNGKGAGQ